MVYTLSAEHTQQWLTSTVWMGKLQWPGPAAVVLPAGHLGLPSRLVACAAVLQPGSSLGNPEMRVAPENFALWFVARGGTGDLQLQIQLVL